MIEAVQFSAVSESELNALLKRPFNPPMFTDAFTSDSFRAEYWATHSVVMDALSILGTQDQLAEGDFCANDNYGHSRFIGVEFWSQRMWRSELIPFVQRALRKQPTQYCVHFDHALLDEPEFSFIVHADSVTGYIPTATHRRAFGV